MNLKGLRVAMSVIVAALLAMMLSGCGGDDDGLSAEDMARISAAEAAAMMAQEDAGEAEMAAAAAEEEAEQAKMDAAAAQQEAEQAKMDAAAADMRAEAAETAAMEAQETADMAVEDSEEPSTVGTTVGEEGRAAAARISGTTSTTAAVPDNASTSIIDESVPAMTMINSGASIKKLEQARLGRTANLTIELASGAVLDSTTDSAEMDAPDVGSDWMGVALEKTGAGGITQRALVYSDAERSVRAFGDVYRYNTDMANADPSTVASEAARTHLRVGALSSNVQSYAQFDDRVRLEHGLTTSGILMRSLNGAGDTLRTVRGTYDGVPGEYRCATAGGTADNTCVIMLDSEGVIWLSTAVGAGGTAAVTSLIFRADNAEQLLPDKDYLAFGVWTVVPDVPTLANPGSVGAFTKASADAFDSLSILTLQGEAKYEGPAAGHYATRARSSHEVDYGRFTAKATITANFNDVTGQSAPPTTARWEWVARQTVPAGTALSATNSDLIARAEYGTTPGVTFSDSKIYEFMDAEGNAMAGWVVNLDGPNKINNMDGMATNIAPNDLPDALDATGTPTQIPQLSDAQWAVLTGATGLLNAALSAGTTPTTAATQIQAIINASRGTTLSGTTDGTTGALSWSGVWDATLHGTNHATAPTGIIGRFQAEAGTSTPVLTSAGDINQFTDQGFAGVVGSFAGR